MELSKIFKEAQKHLWDGISKDTNDSSNIYICFAIEEINGITCSDMNKAKNIIRSRLGRHISLGHWLSELGYIDHHPLHPICSSEQNRKLQETRLAWLKSLEKEFKDKGI